MSGVIDTDGTQWERCNDCGNWVRFSPNCNLGFHKPNKQNPYGRDLCIKCVDAGIKTGTYKFRNIQPATSWKVVEVTA